MNDGPRSNSNLSLQLTFAANNGTGPDFDPWKKLWKWEFKRMDNNKKITM